MNMPKTRKNVTEERTLGIDIYQPYVVMRTTFSRDKESQTTSSHSIFHDFPASILLQAHQQDPSPCKRDTLAMSPLKELDKRPIAAQIITWTFLIVAVFLMAAMLFDAAFRFAFWVRDRWPR